jgi:hypothetical protein
VICEINPRLFFNLDICPNSAVSVGFFSVEQYKKSASIRMVSEEADFHFFSPDCSISLANLPKKKPGHVLSHLPSHPFKVTNGEFIVTGSYGAGQDFINVYHFRYDPMKKSMILKSKDQVMPNDIIQQKPQHEK